MQFMSERVDQRSILKSLEELIGKPIPIVDEISSQKVGVKFEGENITGLSLFLNNVNKLPETVGELINLKHLNLSYARIDNLPDSLNKLVKLESLSIGGNHLTNLPKVIEHLTSLKELILFENRLSSLPKFIEGLNNLRRLDIRDNELTTIPETLLKLKFLEYLRLANNELSALPDTIDNLKSIQELILRDNQLKVLPESIGALSSLRILDLSVNQLTRLPESIGNLQSLEELDLLGNRLEGLPESLANLSSLKKIDVYGNPWKGEWKAIEEGEKKNYLPLIFNLCLKLNGIIVFISHAWDDQKQYRIIDMKKKLEISEKIHEVYVCEEDLIGGIWEFMAENVPKSQILLFIATPNSIKSAPCKFELSLANRYGIKILPLRGKDIEWDDLKNIALSGEGHGTVDLSNIKQEILDVSNFDKMDFEPKNFNNVCKNILDYINEHEAELKASRKDREELEMEKVKFKNFMNDLLISNEFKDKIKENIKDLDKLFQDLSNDRINNKEYLLKIAKLLNQKS